MTLTRFTLIAVLFLGGGLTGCADGSCHQVKYPELAKQATSSATTVAADDVKGGKVSDAKLPEGHVLVYKADGSLQCATGKAVKPADMAADLLDGIKVYSQDTRSDGRMHVQVCGTPTGRINVFEIDATSLPAAEKRGFKKLESAK